MHRNWCALTVHSQISSLSSTALPVSQSFAAAAMRVLSLAILALAVLAEVDGAEEHRLRGAMANLRLRPTALEAEHGAAMEANNGPPPGTSNRWSHPRHGAINIFEAKTAAMAEPRANMEARAVDHHHRDRNSATAASPLEGGAMEAATHHDPQSEPTENNPHHHHHHADH